MHHATHNPPKLRNIPPPVASARDIPVPHWISIRCPTPLKPGPETKRTVRNTSAAAGNNSGYDPVTKICTSSQCPFHPVFNSLHGRAPARLHLPDSPFRCQHSKSPVCSTLICPRMSRAPANRRHRRFTHAHSRMPMRSANPRCHATLLFSHATASAYLFVMFNTTWRNP